jgi:cell division septal protein FtsQ
LTSLALFLKSDFFTTRYFNCRQNISDYCPIKINEFIEQYRGKNILFLNEIKIKNEIKKNFSQIKEVTVKKKFPSTLTLFIEIKKPTVIISLTQNHQNFLATSSAELFTRSEDLKTEQIYLDSEGKMVKIIEEDFFGGLPLPTLILNALQENVSGPETNQQLTFAAKLVDYLVKNISSFEIGQIQDTKISLFLNDIQIIFSTKNSLPKQLESLQLILSRAKISGVKYQKIDLRFDKPIVVQKRDG